MAMMLEHDPREFTFRRTASYRWFAAPMVLLCGGLAFFQVHQRNALAAGGFAAVCACIALGLWLPARWAIWPLRLLALAMCAGFFMMAASADNPSQAAAEADKYSSTWEWLDRWRILIFVGLPALYFGLTGRVGLKAHHKPRIL